MHRDFEACYRAVASRDARFDGRFFTGVTSTGVYCRPVCPARTPARRNVRFFACAAAAEGAGFRACRRCRPEAAPNGPGWDTRSDVVGQGLRLIADGVVDDLGVAGLARRLAVSQRHLHRLFVAELGAGPLAVARTRRAQTARLLLDQGLAASDVAFAAGYGSIRQFNDSIRHAFGASPTQLRRGPAAPATPAALSLRLRAAEPFASGALGAFLAGRALPGVEDFHDGRYRRTVADGTVEVLLPVTGGTARLRLRARLDAPGGLARVVRGVRHLCDLDANPAAVGTVLGADPVLAPLLARRPGLRVPGAVDGFECAVRVVLGQQVSVAAAVTLAGRLVQRHGAPLGNADGSLTHRFPSPDAVAGGDLSGLGITSVRIRALRGLAAAVLDGTLDLDPRGDRQEAVARLAALPGVGPWTVTMVALRALRDPDALPAGDLGLRRALAALGGDGTAAGLAARAERWRPWRSYAAVHLWSAGAVPAARTA